MDPDAAAGQHLGLLNIPILVAEDDPNDVFVLRRAFARAGVEASLYFVRNGPEAIDFLQGNAPFEDRFRFPFPKLLLMDLLLPLLGGLEVLEWFHGRPERRSLRVVVLSGSAAPPAINRAYDLGVDSCFEKPQAEDQVRFVRDLAKYWIEQSARA
jgi:CheY-like chemotaxis protein